MHEVQEGELPLPGLLRRPEEVPWVPPPQQTVRESEERRGHLHRVQAQVEMNSTVALRRTCGLDGTRVDVATFKRQSDPILAAAARNALPRLFAEIDALRARTRGVPILGTVS